MKVERIKAYRDFLLLVVDISYKLECNEDNYRGEIEALKKEWPSGVFDTQYNEFEKELIGNINTYEQNELIHDYIYAHFGEIIEAGGFREMNALSIIRNGFEVEFLIGLKTGLESIYKRLVELCRWDEVYGDYYEIESIRQELEYEKQDKKNVTPESYIPMSKSVPVIEPRFDFDNLKEDVEQLASTAGKIRLYKTRKHDFKRWQLQCDTWVENNGAEYYQFSNLYYPNFCELCDLEIKWLSEELELERRLPVATQLPPEELIVNGSSFFWNRNDTDLLELAVSLHRTNAVKHKEGKVVTLKDLIDQLQAIFNTEIKDVHSKLSYATNRKKTRSPFLSKLKYSFEAYCEERLGKK